MLRRFYDWMMQYAQHPRAVWALTAISFCESSFFPLPPDPLFIGMILAKRQQAWNLALLCTVSSVVGGIAGYGIGYACYETLGSWIIEAFHYQDKFADFQSFLHRWGFWAIAGKGLTPIPYKIVTITSGFVQLDFLTFLSASLIARSFRFYLLAALIWYYGESIKHFIDRNLMWVTTGGLAALISGFFLVKYVG